MQIYSKCYLKHLFQSIFCLVILALVPVIGEEFEECLGCKLFQYARLEAGYSWGDFIGINKDYIELGLFFPLMHLSQCVIFADGRVYQFNDSAWAVSVGLGMRGFTCNGHILGANVYCDHLQSKNKKGFDRLSLGLEYLGSCWDVRVNGYYPIGSESYVFGTTVFDDYDRGFEDNFEWISTCFETEFSISKGFDAELGALLYCSSNYFKIYGAVGPYFYDNKYDNIWGSYVRLKVNLCDYFSIQVRSSYDGVYYSRTQVTALLSLPFDVLCNWQSCKDYCYNLLTQPVHRNGIIFTDKYCSCVDSKRYF